MPCYTVQRTQVALGVKTNAQHLLAALNALKLNALRSAGIIRFDQGYFSERNGVLTLDITGQQADKLTADIKRAYMTQATIATVQKFGFTIKATGANKFQAIKRSL